MFFMLLMRYKSSESTRHIVQLKNLSAKLHVSDLYKARGYNGVGRQVPAGCAKHSGITNKFCVWLAGSSVAAHSQSPTAGASSGARGKPTGEARSAGLGAVHAQKADGLLGLSAAAAGYAMRPLVPGGSYSGIY